MRRNDGSTRLPYRIVIEVEAIESVRHQRLRGRSRGKLEGEGLWLLRAGHRPADAQARRAAALAANGRR